MKTFTHSFIAFVAGISFLFSISTPVAATGTPDSVIMGSPAYANDVYYSFKDGTITTVNRTNWDIAFHTTMFSATVLTNGGANVYLYTYPKSDTAGWNSVDTAGIGTWKIMYDSEKDWENGAFNRNSLGDDIDYGWGKYNLATHDVIGDSIYIIKGVDGIYRKLWIIRKNSSNNIFHLRIANLDGSGDEVLQLDMNPYTSRNFVYFSLSTNSLIDREPESAAWDILFTRYQARYVSQEGDTTDYPVIGVYNNFDIYANRHYPVPPDYTDYLSKPFDSTKSPIGYDWKDFVGSWTLDTATAFFVHTLDNNVYKLVFTKFEGSSTGKIVFDKEPLATGIFESIPASDLKVFPNPAKDRLTIEFGENIWGGADISFFDVTGKQVYSMQQEINDGMLTVDLPSATFRKGLHLLKVSYSGKTFSSRFMVY